MSGYIKDENSLATGIPNRNIGPETGASGNATMTNKGDTAEGTNQDHESYPAGSIGASRLQTDDMGERRSFRPADNANDMGGLPDTDLESVAQQIADGGDHYDRDKRFTDDDKLERGRKHADREGLSTDKLGRPLSDDRLG